MKHLLIISVIAFLFISCNNKKHEEHADEDVYYTCSMDPQVVESKPGKCPICKMPLTPVKKSNGLNKDEIQLSDQQVQLGNIRVDTIRSGMIGDRMILTATLNTDQLRTNSVSTRVMGRIDKLYFKNVGDYVKKGAALFDLYSEELNNAKQEYKLALEKKKTLDNSIVDFGQVVSSAKTKLLLWGMSESQIKELETAEKISVHTTFYSPVPGYITSLEALEGQYVMEGATVLRVADLSALWAEAQVYVSQLAQVDPQSIAEVQFPDFPGKSAKGKIEFVNPEINPETRITLLRVGIPNAGNQLKPGMPAYLLLKEKQHHSLTLPTDAVIQDSKGATVWLQTGKNTFKSKMIEIGMEDNGSVEVKKGLKPGDVVVMSGAYLLNSEYVFKKGTDPMAGHSH
ncbi:efflux RND transporter periplasmic adaptor subunit [Terrimonas pollutisoli]|uniref:efflux RND transporter periplasmic adaptor subunit n=1 Tax=Terrimonas pollutisoli TaxID=3034147 RepID=UPI0023EB3EED|nr:efflux RND transporter periplasmic adaptor subunit [Terrimonas sp. H1YJ31]